MIRSEKLASALYSLHLLLVELRGMSFSNESPEVIGDVLDWAEAMPFLIANADEDRTDRFRSHLLGVVEKHPQFQRVLDAFDANHGFYG